MNTIWKAKRYDPALVVATFAMQYTNGDVKFFEIDKAHKTLHEYYGPADAETLAKLDGFRQVRVK